MKIISLGWGVQSFTLAAMSALGELEPVDFAIHADTTHESQLTLQFAERWTPWFQEHNFKIITVFPIRTDPVKNGYGVSDPPFYTVGPSGNGQSKRQCTSEWKIFPMRRRLSLELQKLGISKTEGIIEQWIGISLDEFQRMKDSDVKYITHRWPLIEKKMTRFDCIKWLDMHGLEVPPKSACTFCPYHSTFEWRRIKSDFDDWNEAISVDKAIRNADPNPLYRQFVHPSRKPLEDVDLRTETEKGQLSLWDQECSGICGV